MGLKKRYSAGVDIGSLASKAVILASNGDVVSQAITKSVHDASVSASNVMNSCLEKAGLSLSNLDYITGTGYGRVNVPFARKTVSEIICHARGVNRIFPSARTVIDVGGQDTKVFSMDGKGMVRSFAMNDKCAAGTGRFLEVMASALDISLNEMGDMAAASPQRPRISNVCTVFAESEIIGLLVKGVPKQFIAAGLCEAISTRIFNLLIGIPLEKDLVMTGGGAKNAGIRKMLGEKTGSELLVPEEPQITGALGAALIGMDIMADGDRKAQVGS